MRFLLTVLLALAFATPAAAQGFLSPIANISPNEASYAVLVDGTRIEGTIPFAMFSNGTLRSLTLKDDSGTKHKLKAKDVASLGNKPSGLAKLAAMSDQMDNKWDMLTADWEGVMSREWVVWEQALLPGKSDRRALMQLLNPGFDSRIKVFFDAKAAGNSDTVMGISVAPSESYIVVVDGKRAVQVKKANYKKLVDDLFGDCADVRGALGKKPKLKNFAAHVYAHHKSCGG